MGGSCKGSDDWWVSLMYSKAGSIMKEEGSDEGFRKLIVWRRAHQLKLSIYNLTEKFPKSEIYGLASQLRRVSVSVPANIAKGYGYGRKGKPGVPSTAHKVPKSDITGILALDLEYINQGEYEMCESLRAVDGFLLHRLQQSIKKS